MNSKKKKPRKSRKTNSQKQNKPKGKLLEQIVAAFYQTSGVKIEPNVDYPTTDGKSTREIDILLKTNVLGLSVEYAFQCKNEIKPIGIGKVTQFFGDLNDIGIPSKYGIFVSVNGFTSDAQRFATNKGIKTLVLSGLTKDRLKSEISSAIQHNIFLIPRIDELSITNAAAESEYDYQFFMFVDENQQPRGTILDLIFNRWQSNKTSQELGQHKIEMDIPINWFQFYKEAQLPPMKISAKISVLAVVITIDGVAENFILLDAETRKVEKFKTQVNFQNFQEGDVIPLTVIENEKELNEFLEKSNNTNLTIKSKLPRLISNRSYYPFSKTVAEKIFAQITKYPSFPNKDAQSEFDKILLESSKDDLFREGIYNVFGNIVPIIVTDNSGDLVDLTLIAEQGDFEKVISLQEKYKENPSNSFRDILAWAYEKKGKQILGKAQLAKVDQDELLQKSLQNIGISLTFNPESISALETKVEILFSLNKYEETLSTIDSILTKKNEDLPSHILRACVLIKLKEWRLASEEIKVTEKLLNKYKGDSRFFRLTLMIYQAEIFHGQEKYQESWSNIFKVWNDSPEEVIRYCGTTNFVIDVVQKVHTVEGRWFHIELAYFRATEFLKLHNFETAKEYIDNAVTLLNSIKLLDEIEEEPVAVGTMNGLFIENTLGRINKLLLNTSNETFVKEQMTTITDWFRRTYKEDPDFLKN